MDSNALKRFEAKFSEADDGCWIWHGATSRGYGQMYYEGRVHQAHRLLYEHVHGLVPDGLTLDHLCHTNSDDCLGGNTCPHRRCVNPSHLEPVTQKVNNARSLSLPTQNSHKEKCPSGHPYAGVNLYVKDGKRYCRKCRAAAGKRWYDKVDGAAYSRQKRRLNADAITESNGPNG
ncbi:hypothetical protein [Micromonospora tulbaghiae]|uniref:hypothetical protein n=1 Tax=Micromonospora tulbaghiae TaxID=479978 RepID=UPI00340ADBC4